MYYVLIVQDSPKQEICGVTRDKIFADWWLSESLIGIAPKRIVREFAEGTTDSSYIEHRWLSNVKQ